MKRISYPFIAIAAVGVLSLGVLATCGIGYATATRSGADYEAKIAATRKKAVDQDENLRQAIVAATGVDTITARDTRRAVTIAMRRPGAGGETIIMRELQRGAHDLPNYPAGAPQKVALALRQHIPIYLKLRNLEKIQASEYASKLDSGWEGTWLRAAGYPKATLTTTSPVSPALSPVKK